MIKITQINGNTLKKLTGAKRVRKTYENKHVDGSGNFGFVVIMPVDDWYRVDGSYGRDGVVSNLRQGPYGGNSNRTPKQDSDLELINSALMAISNGDNELPKKIVVNMSLGDVHTFERQSLQLRNGWVPSQSIDMLHYLILEDANFHRVNNKLTSMGLFGPFKTNKAPVTGEVYYVPKRYGTALLEARYKKYKSLGGRTWEI